jgi:hypothetical protein
MQIETPPLSAMPYSSSKHKITASDSLSLYLLLPRKIAVVIRADRSNICRKLVFIITNKQKKGRRTAGYKDKQISVETVVNTIKGKILRTRSELGQKVVTRIVRLRTGSVRKSTVARKVSGDEMSIYS